ncbi:MAG: ADP-ribosylation factor-like protein [Candidatus Heimdallarchaeota archaeon]|nr:ADP-ribosylation factor-like protein [Candidatus Heimdallarchaeota archaeon]MDH5645507.1 ADP-ribosylation factor-like protein [Candidatus Heimdallarchaeota archaeon]
MRKDAKGKIHFKIVFVGASLAGKTSVLKYLHEQVEGLLKGGLTSIADPSGRTVYFDFSPFSATNSVLFDVYTVAGQRRHKNQRKMILRGVDGLLFVADSNPDNKHDNIEAAVELREFIGDRLGKEIPLVISLNKRDLPNAMAREEMLKDLGFNDDILAINTIAVTGFGLKQAFQAVSREIIMKHIYKADAKAKV